ncbi:MAG: HAMP domain-containing histidine kinase [Prevotella sp.]|nr:HAMP domain-containing histidine kinase [Prevotella sp.]
MEKKDYWKFLLQVAQELRTPMHSLYCFSEVMQNQEWREQMTDDEREEFYRCLDNSLTDMNRMVNTLVDLSYYSSIDRLDRKDRVLINRLCEDVAKEQDVEVVFESDCPDYYAFLTNRECLEKVLRILLKSACQRTKDRKDQKREATVTLQLSERGAKGSLTFIVTDSGDRCSEEENITTFNPPTNQHGRSFAMRTEFYNCWRMVQLLGGFIYIDPHYYDGRRVIFDIAI